MRALFQCFTFLQIETFSHLQLRLSQLDRCFLLLACWDQSRGTSWPRCKVSFNFKKRKMKKKKKAAAACLHCCSMNLSGGGYMDKPWCHIKTSAEAFSEQTLLWRAISLFFSGSAWLCCWCFLSPPYPCKEFFKKAWYDSRGGGADDKFPPVVVVAALNGLDSAKGRMDYLSARAGSSLCLDWQMFGRCNHPVELVPTISH